MTVLYKFSMKKMEYDIFSDGIGMRFDVLGAYKGSLANIDMDASPVDVVSILQQGNLCEVAVVASGNYYKRRVDLTRAMNWVKTVPIQRKTVLSLRRKVKDIYCLQTIYVFSLNTIAPFLSSLL